MAYLHLQEKIYLVTLKKPKKLTLVYLVISYSKCLFKFISKLNPEFETRICLIMHNFIPKRELFSNRATDPSLSKKCDKLIHIYAHCYIENKKLIIEPCSRHHLHCFLIHMLYIWCND